MKVVNEYLVAETKRKMPSLMSLFPLPDFYGVFKEEFLGYNGTHLLFKVKHFIMYQNSFDGPVLVKACN